MINWIIILSFTREFWLFPALTTNHDCNGNSSCKILRLTDGTRAFRTREPSQFWDRRKYVEKRTISYTTSRTKLSRLDSGLNILYCFLHFVPRVPSYIYRVQEKRELKGESVIASNKGLISSNLGTFCYPFSCLAAIHVAKAYARGDNLSVVQSFTNPYGF